MEGLTLIGLIEKIGSPVAVAFLAWQHVILVGRVNKMETFCKKYERQEIVLRTKKQIKKLRDLNLL